MPVRRPRDRLSYLRRRVEPTGHRELPFLDYSVRDPVQAEGAHLAAARVESGGVPPSPEGDNAVRLEHPFGGPVLVVAVGDGERPTPDGGLGDGEQHSCLGGRRSATLIRVRGCRHEGVEPAGEGAGSARCTLAVALSTATAVSGWGCAPRPDQAEKHSDGLVVGEHERRHPVARRSR